MSKKKLSSNIRDPITKKWLDTSVFRKEALTFLSKGYYTEAPTGTPDWLSYWTEQLRRCKEGYEVIDNNGDIHKITGHHYAYLNFAQILLVRNEEDEDEEDSLAVKEISFPDFWDGDYEFFWGLEIARNGFYSKFTQVPSTDKEKESYKKYQKKLRNLSAEDFIEIEKIKEERNKISLKIIDRLGLKTRPHLDYLNGGHHFIVGKARRKGYSFKNGLIVANTYNTIRNKLTLIGAYEKKFIDQTMDKTLEYINFFNEFTGFAKNKLIDKKTFIKSGYVENVNGIDIEKGFKSVIDATRTFKDNPDAMRGVDAYFILLEEAGAFNNLADAYNAIVPSLTAGSKITGQICIIGTSGDLEGGTRDYADMFYNPLAYNLQPYENIWDENSEGTMCGFFHSAVWNMEGFYDKQGNSDIDKATEWELKRRKKILDNASSSLLLQKHMQEFPLCPADAFSMASVNTFPTTELRNQLNKVVANNLNLIKGTPSYLYYDNGKLKVKPDLNKELQPIYNYKPKLDDLSGAVVIYEYPESNPPKGLYKIGYDPYRQDMSSGVSLGAIYVVKGVQSGSSTKNCIVAEYIGRPQEADDVNKISLQLAELYNTEVMYENEVTHVKNYFRRLKKLNYLAVQPDNVISANIKSSKVARVYGCHMNDKLKDAGEKYLKDWLLEVSDYDENGDPIRNLDRIYSIGLLEELIQYNRKNNFDRVSAMFMCMMQIQEETLGKIYEKNNSNNRTKEMIKLMNNFFKRKD